MSRPTLAQLIGYFLSLGTVGFGGPIALTGAMQRDLVERRAWIEKADFLDGLALAQLAPGPLAAQLAIYVGWLRAGVRGATLVGLAFTLPSFLMVLALSAAYVHFGGMPWIQGSFYGIGAAVVVVIARSAVKLARMTLGRGRLLWGVFALNAVLTAWTGQEIVWVILASGILAWIVVAPFPLGTCAAFTAALAPHAAALPALPESPPGALLVRIFLFFTEAGAFVFGSGLAIVPFLRGGVVDRLHWLNDQQFLDAVAVAMITPGPVVITVAFIGYLVAGPLGAAVAAVAVFLPCYLFVVIPAPHFGRLARNRGLAAFVQGVTAAATGALLGAVVVLGRRAIVDLPTAGLALAALAAFSWARRVPEPLVILAAGLAGFGLKLAAR